MDFRNGDGGVIRGAGGRREQSLDPLLNLKEAMLRDNGERENLLERGSLGPLMSSKLLCPSSLSLCVPLNFSVKHKLGSFRLNFKGTPSAQRPCGGFATPRLVKPEFVSVLREIGYGKLLCWAKAR